MKHRIRRILCLVITVAMLLSMLPVVASAADAELPFTDVTTAKWFYDAVRYVYENGLMVGTTATTFAPNAPLTRGMFVTILGRMEGVNTASYSGNTGFQDVNSALYYAPYVKWAAQKGIVNGVAPNRFAPEALVTREQMATIIYRYLQSAGTVLPDSPDAADYFADMGSVSGYAMDPVEALRTTGLFRGDANSNFTPRSNATRAEAAALFMRLTDGLHELDNITDMLETPDPDFEIYSFDISERSIPVGQSTTVTFTAEIFQNVAVDSVVVNVTENGSVIGTMHDDGTNGDAVAEDGIWTLQINLRKNTACSLDYQATVSRYSSETLAIAYYEPMSDEVANSLHDLDNRISTFVASAAFQNADEAGKAAMLLDYLQQLCDEGLVLAGFNYDSDFGLVNYTHWSGIECSVMLRDWDDVNPIEDVNSVEEVPNLPTRAVGDPGTGHGVQFLHAFGDSDYRVNWYNERANKWNRMGLETSIDWDVTVDDLKHLDTRYPNADIFVFSMHGGHTTPDDSNRQESWLCLIEPVTDDNDDDYDYELYNSHSIKHATLKDGTRKYWVRSKFFTERYSSTTFRNKFFFSETCGFFGFDEVSTSVNYRLADSLTGRGAEAVVGYHNSVYADYSRDVAAFVIEQMYDGQTVREALDAATEQYGENDNGNPPAYPVLSGKGGWAYNANGALAGAVKRADTEEPIANALIRVYRPDDTLVTSARTKADGSYRIPVLSGKYVVKISSGSFKTATFTDVVRQNATTFTETFLLTAASWSFGTLNGIINHALNGRGVEDVTIRLRKNWNNRSGQVVATATTNSNGSFEISYQPGSFTMEFSKSGYVTGYKNVTLVPFVNSNGNATITPLLDSSEYRIVLTWGEYPRDLDSHMRGTTIYGDSDHIFYYDQTGKTANLDWDDTSSYGPETVTVTSFNELVNGFTYYVHDFSNRDSYYSTSLSASSARVRVYRGSVLIKDYFVPTGREGTLWTVFSVDRNGAVTDINQMSYYFGDTDDIGR